MFLSGIIKTKGIAQSGGNEMSESDDGKYTAAQVLIGNIEKEFLDYRDALIERYKDEKPYLGSDDTVWENLCKCIDEGRVGGYDAITDVEENCDNTIEDFSLLELKAFYLYSLGFEHKLSSVEKGNLDEFDDADVLEKVRGIVRKKLTNSVLLEAKEEISKK